MTCTNKSFWQFVNSQQKDNIAVAALLKPDIDDRNDIC